MIKYLILFIHLIGLSFYQLIFGDVSVSQNLPSNFSAGEEVVVEVVVKKEGVGGFAKVQQTLPEGFTAEVVDAKGATFSFKDNIVKFIWMALPSENEFKISYKLKTLENVEGNFIIAGKFSFIDENERKNIEIPSSAITISKKEEVVADVVEEDIATEIEEDVVVEIEETIIEESLPVVAEETTTENKSVIINCERSIVEADNGNSFNVSVKILQTNLEGFAKIVETIPAGFTAEIIDSKGGVFSFKDNEAKILWMAAPTAKEFNIAYKLVTMDVTPDTYTINGTFSYLDNDITQKYIINSSEFTLSEISEDPIANVVEEPIDEEVITEVIEDEVVEETPVEEEVSTTNKITSTPSPETGVSYKVQVGAGHQKVSSNYFANKFNLSDPVATEAHQGWIKYIVGSYSEYKAARDKRNTVRNNVKTAFVTAYNKGSRITVQEALMISNQKWYK
tara:strand:+ start:1711 stop:3063 length:1353 start_codon:yes stop_codon:yes gene_type:complete